MDNTTPIEIKEVNEIKPGTSSGASEHMKMMMKVNYDTMTDRNTPYDGDLEKLQARQGLDCREVMDIRIVTIPGFGELHNTDTAALKIMDMDAEGIRSIDHLYVSHKLKKLSSLLPGSEIMTGEDVFVVLNTVASHLGITDRIDEQVINEKFQHYQDTNLPQDDNVGRVLRALYMMLGDWFMIPIAVDPLTDTVRSVGSYYNDTWVHDDDYGYRFIRPFSKING